MKFTASTMCLAATILVGVSARGPAADVASPRDDAAWLKSGTLILEDSFNREEDGNLAAAIGNGWNSATANRAPDVKQADLDSGVLKVTTTAKAGHGAHIHHEALLEDGGAIVRFKLPGLSKGENLTVGFVDRQTSKSLAGHLCYAFVNGKPAATIVLMDKKTGVSDPEVAKRREPFLKSREKLPPDLDALLAAKTKELKWPADDDWHELVLVTEGDEMRVTLDGMPLGSHRSEGFAHPTKRWFSLGIPTTAWIDDVKVYKVK
jgi:hypothetical protein